MAYVLIHDFEAQKLYNWLLKLTIIVGLNTVLLVQLHTKNEKLNPLKAVNTTSTKLQLPPATGDNKLTANMLPGYTGTKPNDLSSTTNQSYLQSYIYIIIFFYQPSSSQFSRLCSDSYSWFHIQLSLQRKYRRSVREISSDQSETTFRSARSCSYGGFSAQSEETF